MNLFQKLLVILALGIFPLFAIANERFIQICESSLTNHEKEWLHKSLGPVDCKTMSDKISRLKSFDEFLPPGRSSKNIINQWIGYNTPPDFDLGGGDYIQDLKIKAVLFRELNAFEGFKNLKHAGLLQVSFQDVCDIVRRFPHLEKLTLERNEFFRPGIDNCLAAAGIKGVFLTDSFEREGHPLAPIITTRTPVLGIENWRGSFKPLTRLPELKYLHFSKADSTSGIEVLGSSLRLTHLMVEISDFSNVTAIGLLKELRTLSIGLFHENGDSNKRLRDISFIQNLRFLKHLSLDHNSVTDLRPLNSLKLESLSLISNWMKTAPDLSGLKNLKTLNLSKNFFESLDSFKAPETLESLNLAANGITDFTPLGKITNLRALNITANEKVKKLVLPRLPKLRILGLDGAGKYSEMYSISLNQKMSDSVTTITRSLLSTLNYWRFGGNCETQPMFEELAPLEGFDELEVLTLRDNDLTSLPDLSSLKKLKYLNVSGNRLTSFPAYLPSLKLINVSQNENFPMNINGPEIYKDDFAEMALKCSVTDGPQTEIWPPQDNQPSEP